MKDNTALNEMDLPLSNPNEDLETISKTRLLPLFDVSKFEIRPEDLRDKGIDLHIEVKISNKYTNIRFVVQLKATDSKNVNRDGSISFQVYTSNINYLLNNPGPAYYILYSKSTDTFYYENLNDFIRVLASKETEWQNQKSHTLRFSKILTKVALDEIYNHALEKGKFHRKVNDMLIRQSASIQPSDKILVDSDMAVSSDRDIRELIELAGFNMINEGKWKEVILLHRKGSGTIASTSKYNLILGIANYYGGNLLDALSFLKSSGKLRADLIPELDAHLEFFVISVKHSLGLCTDIEYYNRMNELQDADNVGLYIRIDKAKSDYYTNLTSDSEHKFGALINSIQQILGHPKADNAIKFYAESELVLMQGSKNNWGYVKDIATINAIETFSGPDSEIRKQSAGKFIEANSKWFKDVEELKERTLKSKNYFYYFNTLINQVKVIYEMTVFTGSISIEESIPGDARNPVPDNRELFKDLFGKLERALHFFRQIGHIENEIVSLSLRYELEHYLNDFSKAATTLAEAETLLEAYELPDKKRRMEYLRNAGTVHEVFAAWINRVSKEAESSRNEYKQIVADMMRMDEEERKQSLPDSKRLHIDLMPIGTFCFPESAKQKLYEILQIPDDQLRNHFDHLFGFVIPIVNLFYNEITREGPLDGNLADKGIQSWRNIYRVRKAFFENKFFRDESRN
jgi:hypothetical protein